MARRKKRRTQHGRAHFIPSVGKRREDELVTELHAYDHALGVRDKILARLASHVTDGERA